MKSYQSINDDSPRSVAAPSWYYRKYDADNDNSSSDKPSGDSSPTHPLLQSRRHHTGTWTQRVGSHLRSTHRHKNKDKVEEKSGEEDHATLDELITAFYQLEDMRVPPSLNSLRAFYIFFVFLGVPIGSVRYEDRPRARHAFHAHDDNVAHTPEMESLGISPYPLDNRRPKSWWRLIQKPAYVYAFLCMIALAYYTVINVVDAMCTSFKFLKTFFAIFFCLAVISSVYLAHDILTRRLIGTRIYYALNNTGRPHVMHHWIQYTIYTQMGLCLAMGAVGISADYSSVALRQEAFDTLTTDPTKQRYLIAAWLASSVIVNLQFVTGVAVFAAACSTYLMRINSCLRSLKRPGTTVQSALAQVFDIDVSLADFSQLLNWRMSMLLVSCFLTFFCQSVFLGNNKKDESPHSETSEILTVLFPGLVSVYILLGYSGINNACQEVKLVAGRYATFEKLNVLYSNIRETGEKQKEKRKKEKGKDKHKQIDDKTEDKDSENKDETKSKNKDSENKDESKNNNKNKDESKSEKKDKDGKQSKDKKKGDAAPRVRFMKDEEEKKSNSDDERHAHHIHQIALGDEDYEKEHARLNEKSKETMQKQHGDVKNNTEEEETRMEKNQDAADRDVDEVHSKALAGNDGDQDGIDDDQQDILHVHIKDDPKLLSECIDFLENYLDKYSDVSLRLANFRVDQSIAWAFFLLATSTIFSLLDLDKSFISV